MRDGHRALLERGGDDRALVLHRAHQHADLVGRHAVRDQPLGLGRHGLGLGALRAAAPEAHPAARGAAELLVDPVVARLHHGARGREDAPAGAVVALETDHLGVRELALEVEQVLLRGAAEAVDRLVVVARPRSRCGGRPRASAAASPARSSCPGTRRPARAGSAATCARARAASRGAAGRRAAPGRRSRARRPRPAAGRGRRTARRTRARAPRWPGRRRCRQPRPAPRRSAGTQRSVTISSFRRSIRATKLGQQRRRVAADLVVADREVVDPLEQQRQPVGRGDRREERVEARLERLVAEQPRAEGVEGGHVQALVGRLDLRLEPLAHLRGRRRGEGEREDRVRGRALLHEPGESAREREGLAGARAGQHEQRPPGMGHGRQLGAREAVQRGGHSAEDTPRPSARGH